MPLIKKFQYVTNEMTKLAFFSFCGVGHEGTICHFPFVLVPSICLYAYVCLCVSECLDVNSCLLVSVYFCRRESVRQHEDISQLRTSSKKTDAANFGLLFLSILLHLNVYYALLLHACARKLTHTYIHTPVYFSRRFFIFIIFHIFFAFLFCPR